MELDVRHIFTPELCIKTTLYVHTVTSHCVSNAHVHTTTHTCTCNTQICMYIYAHDTAHAHMHTQHHVHAGWSRSSPWCKPGGSWQDCGDAPSGWGYSRPAEQGVICSSVTCVVPCALFIVQKVPHNIQQNKNIRKRIQQITTADMHWRIKSFVHWKHVNLVHGLGTFFFSLQKIWTENASLGSKLQWIF